MFRWVFISHRHSPPQRLLLGFQLKKNGQRARKCSFHFALSAARVLFLPFQSSYVTKRPPRRRVSHRGNLKAHPRMTKQKKEKKCSLNWEGALLLLMNIMYYSLGTSHLARVVLSPTMKLNFEQYFFRLRMYNWSFYSKISLGFFQETSSCHSLQRRQKRWQRRCFSLYWDLSYRAQSFFSGWQIVTEYMS